MNEHTNKQINIQNNEQTKPKKRTYEAEKRTYEAEKTNIRRNEISAVGFDTNGFSN